MILAKIHVQLKASVLDPQGEAVSRSLQSLGYNEVQEVRVGKLVEVKFNLNDQTAAAEAVRGMCESLLANTVIEKYSFELTEVSE